ncbi:energy transducer TonB [Alteromonas sediminis]|uniref:Energy transducer TonB n=1 Tax=Alteromonas sediminis TaxID=2259342 RepID=A0A3N5Y973_9ALTE|nr:energy transducer TonB [Alteromonas sediminis]RPJ65125.1 energy transducer TonB [Alteromonas sediminis]
MKYTIAGSLIVLLLGCTSTSHQSSTEYGVAERVQLSDQQKKTLERFPPKYPTRVASSGIEGCATIEYVVTPDFEVQDVNTLVASNPLFATEAQKVIKKWRWENLASDFKTGPLKFQTRFEYCLENGSGRCSMNTLLNKTQCSGNDVVPSVGMQM